MEAFLDSVYSHAALGGLGVENRLCWFIVSCFWSTPNSLNDDLGNLDRFWAAIIDLQSLLKKVRAAEVADEDGVPLC